MKQPPRRAAPRRAGPRLESAILIDPILPLSAYRHYYAICFSKANYFARQKSLEIMIHILATSFTDALNSKCDRLIPNFIFLIRRYYVIVRVES